MTNPEFGGTGTVLRRCMFSYRFENRGLTMGSSYRVRSSAASVLGVQSKALRWIAHGAMPLLLAMISVLPGNANAGESVQIPALISSIASKTLLTDSVRLSDRVVAVGSHGVIVYSKNNIDWVQAKVPSQVLLTTVFFIDDKEGWAAGHDTLILHTTDGGESWSIQYEDPITGGDLPKPILDIYFKDKLHGWAIGAFSLMLETQDGGANWEIVDTGDLYDLLESLDLEPEPNFNAFLKTDRGFFIVGELGTLLHYDTEMAEAEAVPDAAVEEPASAAAEGVPTAEAEPSHKVGPWQVFESPYSGSYFGVSQLRNGEFLIYGLRGHIYRATQLGGPWTAIDTGGRIANINKVIERENGEAIAVGAGGTLFRIGAGATKASLIPYAGFDGFVSVEKAGPNELLLFGDAGVKVFTLPNH